MVGQIATHQLVLTDIEFECVGPAFNLFLAKCHFTLGPFLVERLAAPGVSVRENREIGGIISLFCRPLW